MSAVAIAKLQQLWGKLSFQRIDRVIAREPEDILLIQLAPNENGGHHKVMNEWKRTSDVPPHLRSRARVSWRHYFGFTREGTYFQMDDYNKLDCDISLTMDFSSWGNHIGGYEKPTKGTLIGGVVVDGPKGKRFQKWFPCPPQLQLLIDIVLHGTNMSEWELGRRLVVSDYPDKYWAIARLVLFDNVQAFVDQLKMVDHDTATLCPIHPAHGMYTGAVMPDGERLRVHHTGMYLPIGDPAEYIHLMSHVLEEPKWWEDFKRLAKEQGIELEHPHWLGYCRACEAEKQQDPDYWLNADYGGY